MMWFLIIKLFSLLGKCTLTPVAYRKYSVVAYSINLLLSKPLLVEVFSLGCF